MDYILTREKHPFSNLPLPVTEVEYRAYINCYRQSEREKKVDVDV